MKSFADGLSVISGRNVAVTCAAVLLLSGCAELTEFLGGGGSCSSYNASIDGFRQSLDTSDLLLLPGGTASLTYTASWLDSNLDREELNCDPEWQYDPTVIAVDSASRTVRGVGVGTTQLTAVVRGSGGTQTDSIDVGVMARPTESEPNNGIGFATQLTAGTSMVGVSDYRGDFDYYEFTVPSGATFQVSVYFSIDPDFGSGYYTFGSADIRDSSDDVVGYANYAYTNEGPTTETYYVRVSTSGPISYFVELVVD